MTAQGSDSEKYGADAKKIVEAMIGHPIDEIVSAISKLAPGITVADDGEIHMRGHTKSKMTINYQDGSKGTAIVRTARSMLNTPST